jgi:hypothetical protein
VGNTIGKCEFAVRFERTTKVIKRTAKLLPCIFLENARQKAHGSILHGKGPLPCFFIARTAKPLCRASNPAHGELTGNGTTDGTGRSPNSSPRLSCASH